MINSSASTAPNVRIWREGQFLYVEPPCEELLKPVLTTHPWTCRLDNDGKPRLRQSRQPLYEIDSCASGPVLTCSIGLAIAVHAVLQISGYRVSLAADLCHTKLPILATTHTECQFLDFVAQHDRGLIRYSADRLQVADLIGEIARAWPGLRVAVVSSREMRLHSLAQELLLQGIHAVAYTDDWHPRTEAMVALTTYVGMHYAPVDPEWQDLIIALDTGEAIREDSMFCLSHCDRARLYGLLTMCRHMSPHEDDLVRSLFGFEELVLLGRSDMPRHVEVVWADGDGRALQRMPANIFEIKRYGIWRNDSRNRQVARLARAFAVGHRDELAKLCPGLPAPRLPNGPTRVIVLVENVEHAIQLAPKLPGWPVVPDGRFDLGRLSIEQEATFAGRSLMPIDLTAWGIVTQAGLDDFRLHWPKTDVLIRADGGTGLPSLPEYVVNRPCLELPKRLLLVDLVDRHQPDLRRRAHHRHQAYVGANWPPPSWTAADVRLHEFLLPRLRNRRMRAKT